MEIVISQRCSIIYAAANHLRRRSDGPSYSGNLPNLIVLGGIFVILFPFFFSFVFAASLSDLEFIRSMRETGERVE